MAVVLVASWWLLLAEDFERLGILVIAQSFFSSNFLFWSEADYFGPAADQTPLLHMWSLVGEEQFYLAFPFVLVFATIFAKRDRMWLFVFAGRVSLMISIWATLTYPDAAFTFRSQEHANGCWKRF